MEINNVNGKIKFMSMKIVGELSHKEKTKSHYSKTKKGPFDRHRSFLASMSLSYTPDGEKQQQQQKQQTPHQMVQYSSSHHIERN